MIRLLRRAVHGPAAGLPAASIPEIRVEGPESDGLVQVAVIDRETDRVFRLRVPDVNSLIALAGPSLRATRDLPASALPFLSRTAKPLSLQALSAGDTVSATLLAGPTAQAAPGIVSCSGSRMQVAGYTCRGPTLAAQGMEYKAFNEDAVVLRVRRGDTAAKLPEVAAIGAFDQAGGEGQVADRPGAASELAAQAFSEAVAQIERGEEPQAALRNAIIKAGRDVLALGVGAVTTFAGAVVVATPGSCEAYVAVVGDSRVMQVDRAGKLVAATDQHNFGRAVAAGLVDDVPPPMALRFAGVLTRSVGAEPADPDLYVWKLNPGDRLVAETDGLADARELEEMPEGTWHADRCAKDQARVVGHAKSSPEAVMALVGYALDQMADGYGKPDNLGVAVLEVLSDAKP